jgi:hypothetical protein
MTGTYQCATPCLITDVTHSQNVHEKHKKTRKNKQKGDKNLYLEK